MTQCFYWNDDKARGQIASILRSGRVIAGDSDTVLGLLAALTESNRDKLNVIKERFDKPYLILVGDKQKVGLFTDALNTVHIEKVAEKFWPGPLTLILPAKKKLPKFMQSKEGNIAIRVPQHEGLLAVLKEFDGLFSTSANKTGKPIPHTIEELDSSIKNQVAALVLNERDSSGDVSSTILDCTGSKIRLVREGAFTRDKLTEVISLGE